MYIEWLKFRVQPELRSQFIHHDRQIWTAFLAESSAFVHKEVWLNPEQADEVVTIIHWSDREQWKAIPVADLKRIDQSFQTAMGAETYELLESKEYQLMSVSGSRSPEFLP